MSNPSYGMPPVPNRIPLQQQGQPYPQDHLQHQQHPEQHRHQHQGHEHTHDGRNTSAGADEGPGKPKKTRKRQQTSCVECHRRKQKCNKEVPCDRCIKRGSSASCRIMPVGEGKEENDEEPYEHRQQHQPHTQSYHPSQLHPHPLSYRSGSGGDTGPSSAHASGPNPSFLPRPTAPQSALYYAPAPVQHPSYGSSSSRTYDADRQALDPPSLGRNLSDEQQASTGKRRRTNDSDELDLAARVRQLEDIIRLSQLAGSNTAAGPSSAGPVQRSPPVYTSTSSASDAADPPIKAESNAVEEAAVAALSTLSAVKTKEGGGEFRIYSGPGSVTAFLSSSDFHKDDSEPYINTRVRPADLQLYSQGLSSVIDMTNAPPRVSKLTDAILEQKMKLPPPALCHYLFNYFHEVHLFADRHANFPRGCYQHSYDALFTPEHRDLSEAAEKARALRFPQLASEHSLAFISLVFVMLALALSLSPDTSPESHQLASALYENSRQAFMASERREQPTYAVILTLISHTVWLKIAGCPSLGFTYIAQATRFAQAQGLHRRCQASWGISNFEAEIRRRIWWSLALTDKFHSLVYGRPYIILAQHCDVDLPTNMYQEDLTAEGPRAEDIKDKSEVTQMTLSIIQSHFAEVLREIIDRALSCTTPTYSTILQLDRLMTAFEDEHVPAAFKNPSLADLTSKPWLKKSLEGWSNSFAWLRALLHRPYLLRKLPKRGEVDHYAHSRALAIALSQKMLQLTRQQLAAQPLHLLAYFGCAFHTFEPAVNLAVAILQDPGSAQAMALDGYVVEAIARLEHMAPVNKVAGEGVESLRSMRAKYLQAIADTSTSADRSPSASTSYSSSGASSNVSGNGTSGPSPSSIYTSSSSSFAASNKASPASSDPTAIPPTLGTRGHQTLTAPPIAPEDEAAATPNTLFARFFGGGQVDDASLATAGASAASPALPSAGTAEGAASAPNGVTMDLDKLFAFDPTFFANDNQAAWMSEPMVGGLEQWWPPISNYNRLEGESDMGDWKKMLGF